MAKRSPEAPLAHLDDASMQTLMERYYAGEPVRALLAEFGVACKANQLLEHLPLEVTDQPCPACGAPLGWPRMARGEKARRGPRGALRCTQCDHQEASTCGCLLCRQAREEAEARALEAIAACCAAHEVAALVVEPEALNADAAVGLLTLVRCGGWLDRTTISPFSTGVIPFGPASQPDMHRRFLEPLLTSRLIAPSPDSPRQAFEITPEGTVGLNGPRVLWTLQMVDPPAFVRRLERFVAVREWPESWEPVIQCRWRELATAECVDWCHGLMGEEFLKMSAGVSLITLIDNLLDDFSLRQCGHLFRETVREVSEAYPSSWEVENERAFVNLCQRRADQARVSGLPPLEKDGKIPFVRSQLSHVLHDLFLKHGPDGYLQTRITSCGTGQADGEIE